MELCLNRTEVGSLVPAADPLRYLVARVASRDEVAMGDLYDATCARVFGLSLKILRDRAAAEESTLDVYAQVWREAGRYDPARGGVLAWILNLARSRAIDIFRTRARSSAQEETLNLSLVLADLSPGPEEFSLEAERARKVRTALRGLPEEQRRVIEAAFFGGLSHTEVAEALGQPLGTVKTRIRTGLATLRRALGSAEEGFA